MRGTIRAAICAAALLPAAAMAKTYGCSIGGTGPTGPTTTGQCGGYEGYGVGEPRYGSPNSMQFQNAAVSLDLFDVQPEGADAFTPEGDSDTIGGAFTYGKAGFQHDERYDLHYQHARRIGEGTRARFLVDVPVSIAHYDQYDVQFKFGNTPVGPPVPFGGHTAVYGTVNVGVEFPVTPNFLVTPRISYSNTQAGSYFAKDAELANGSVTGRYKLPQVGRGDLVFGGMIAYSHTIDTFLAKQPFFDSLDFWTARGGLAYQLPLKRRIFGRQSSLRASYVFTEQFGEKGFAYTQVHEAGVSIGVRTREAEQKNRFEQMRVGLLYTHTKNNFTGAAGYDAVTATFGYRF